MDEAASAIVASIQTGPSWACMYDHVYRVVECLGEFVL